MKKFDVHVCMVSDQAAANLIPILDKNFRPKEVVLVVTERMREQAKNFENVLHAHGIKTAEIKIKDPFDLDEITEALEKLIVDKLDSAQSLALNVTGGTKLMAIGAQQAFQEFEQSIFYTLSEKNKILILGNTKDRIPAEEITLKSNLKLSHYLMAYGYEIEKKEDTQSQYDRKKLTQELIKYYDDYKDGIAALNALASEAGKSSEGERLIVQLSEHKRNTTSLSSLLKLMEEGGILKRIDADKIEFMGERQRVFANGGWLEEYVFNVVNSLTSVQDKALNLTVIHKGHSSKQSTKNELDVAFLSNNLLHIIECKTASSKNLEDDFIYKLDVLSKIGGYMTKACIISYDVISQKLKNRAASQNILWIEGNDIARLKTKLSDWIRPKS